MSQQIRLSRRKFMATSASFAGLTLSGCATAVVPPVKKPAVPLVSMSYRKMYGPIHDERFPIPGVDLSKVDSKFYRREVNYSTSEPVGTVIVNTKTFYLYVVQENGTAMRYGVGLGRAGFEWSGRGRIGWKQEWPKWTPPREMIARLPELEKYSAANGGMPPGIDNPLGARALYIFQGKRDTLYRLHGTVEDFSIGRAVSSGCVRLLNQDVIDLYGRVATGSKIMVV
ncbi:MAG: L,D-transpeptidase [Rhizobiaceae bacterium]|nr:L,D-transpeptidase [Rhizobiaceae bacterium]